MSDKRPTTQDLRSAMETFRRVLELNIGVAQPDNAVLFEELSKLYPLQVDTVPSGSEHNGWIVPDTWTPRKALIKKNGEIVFDGSQHPLAVIGNSRSFCGTLSKNELDKHVFTNPRFRDAYQFHSMNNYRAWATDWGFCVPDALYQNWSEGEYQVELEVEHTAGEMHIGHCTLEGQSSDTIVFNAHTCHPLQANDGMSGVIVILELFKWLAKRKNRFSYVGVLAPEHLGTVFHIANMDRDRLAAIKLGCFVEMVGTNGPLTLQQTFYGDTLFDALVEQRLQKEQPDLHVGPFRSIVGNDETVWEAPGIEVPMLSVSRWPYAQYHTDHDNLNIISKTKLQQTLEVLKGLVGTIEDDAIPTRQFEGLIALSNPKYGLYIERQDPVVDKQLSDFDKKIGYMQDHLQRYFEGDLSILEISLRFRVPFRFLLDYLRRFEEKGLLTLEPVSSLTHYAKRIAPSFVSPEYFTPGS